jgi:hypothetical protein
MLKLKKLKLVTIMLGDKIRDHVKNTEELELNTQKSNVFHLINKIKENINLLSEGKLPIIKDGSLIKITDMNDVFGGAMTEDYISFKGKNFDVDIDIVGFYNFFIGKESLSIVKEIKDFRSWTIDNNIESIVIVNEKKYIDVYNSYWLKLKDVKTLKLKDVKTFFDI